MEIYVIRIQFFQKQIATILKQEKFVGVRNNGLANTQETSILWESRSQTVNSLLQTVFSAACFLYVLLEWKLQKSSSKQCLIGDVYLCYEKFSYIAVKY